MTHDVALSHGPRAGEPLHPRPQFQRTLWRDLCGQWSFAYDDDDLGRRAKWFETGVSERTIVVPFPPESAMSGIGDTSYHSILWYSRIIGSDDLAAAGLGAQGERMLLHFGAVDYEATVWLDGKLLGEHTGGHTPFTLELTDHLGPTEHLLVVRVVDRGDDVGQARGKQDWRPEPHGIWYNRTSGIWQPVWLEAVRSEYIREACWVTSQASESITLDLRLSGPPRGRTTARVILQFEGEVIAETTSLVDNDMPRLTMHLRRQLNGEDFTLHWSPEKPRLIDARIELESEVGSDVVESYIGLRSVAIDAGRFLLNEQPYFVRSVLQQGYWPQSQLAAPDADALRTEVELIKSLGFNAVRIHQKIEDPRFLYWADRLGLLVWGESAAAFEFTSEAVVRFTSEWMDAVRRDRSHPCIVTWVPMNESWGAPRIKRDPAQQAFSRALSDLTRALDPTRPVISNDGWEHTTSDLNTIHDYDADPERMRERYASQASIDRMSAAWGPVGRKMLAGSGSLDGLPVMISEFGGIRFVTTDIAESWGYASASSPAEFEASLTAVFGVLNSSPLLAGYCYTQLTDTMQEANGLTDENRVPKLPVRTIRAIVTGEAAP